MKYTEDNLKTWAAPLSETESTRVENTIRMIKDAIKSSTKLSNLDIEVFVQGSYANNTNVRQNSDVDICVMLSSTFYCEYVTGKTRSDYGHIKGSIEYETYKSYILDAIREKFGYDNIKLGNKSLKIQSNTYHVNADVVPAFQYKNYQIINSLNPNVYVEGIKYFSLTNDIIITYPKIHIENGKNKNVSTNYKYKKIVRIMKHIKNSMVEDNKANGNIITPSS